MYLTKQNCTLKKGYNRKFCYVYFTTAKYKKIKGRAPNSVVCCLLPCLGVVGSSTKSMPPSLLAGKKEGMRTFETHRPKKATFMCRRASTSLMPLTLDR